MGLIWILSSAELHYGSCCDLGHAHTHTQTHHLGSKICTAFKQLHPHAAVLVSGNGRDMGRELQQAWLNPEAPRTNSPLLNKRTSQQPCQQVQAAALAHARLGDAPVSPASSLAAVWPPQKEGDTASLPQGALGITASRGFQYQHRLWGRSEGLH